MATQDEVITAFLNFDTSPWSASNFKMHTVGEGGQRAFLVGGGHAVYAEREPIDQITLYPDWRRWYGWTDELDIDNRYVQRQCQMVRARILPDHYANSVEDEYPNLRISVEERGNGSTDRVYPTVSDYECLDNE